MAQQYRTPEPFSSSRLYMWRCVTAMAHADGIVGKEERDYLLTIFGNMRTRDGMSNEYYDMLLGDLETAVDPGDMLRHINEPAYRAQVVYFARLLAFKDGHMHPSEQELLDKLHASVMSGLDFEAIRKEVQENVQHELILHDIKIDENRPDSNLKKGRILFKLVDELALKYGIDLIRD